MPKKKVIKKSALSPTVLIAGGAGFIGSHLADVFLANGARVIVLDNFSTGKEIYIKEQVRNPNFALFNVDINLGLPKEIESVDYVIHLAGLEEYLFSKELVNLDSLLTNSVGTKNLLDFGAASEARFLLVSSIDVYQGRMSQLEIGEYFGKTKLDESKYMLTEAKRYAEALVWEYYKKQNTDVRIVRLPEIFGPRMSMESSGALGNFLKDLIEGRQLTVYGEGDNREYYLYVSDAIAGIVKALFNPQTKGNIYSLVSSECVSDVELAYIVRSLADREIKVNIIPEYPEALIKHSSKKPDTFNLKDLEWEPKVKLKDGVFKTLSWFGYHPNEFSFKPSKLIEEKNKTAKNTEPFWEKAKSIFFSSGEAGVQDDTAHLDQAGTESATDSNQDLVFSLQGVKEERGLENLSVDDIPEAAAPSVRNTSDDIIRPRQGYPVSPPAEAVKVSVQDVTASQASAPQIPAPADAGFSAGIHTLPSTVEFKNVSLLARLGNIFKKSRKPDLGINFAVKTPGKLSLFLRTNVWLMSGVFVSVILAVIIFVVVPLGTSAYHIKQGLSYLQAMSQPSLLLDSEKLKYNSKNAYSHLYKAKKSLANTRWLFAAAGKRGIYDSASKTVSSLVFFSKASYNLADAVKPFENLWEIIRPDTAQELDPAVYEDAKTKISGAGSDLQLAQADFKYVNPSIFDEDIRAGLVTYGNALNSLVETLSLAEPVLTEMPAILGSTETKRYMILFQNNNEIRPTGGFIGSYGVITLEKGKIKSLEIDDIYNPDGQLDIKNISYSPPEPIKEYLGEDRLHIRNANWSPEFPISAETIRDLYRQVSDEQVDGVFAVDLYFVQELLKVTGPVFLTAYNEEITSENLYERTQFYSEFNYINGSDQKKSFLTVLGSKLLERFFSMSKEQAGNLAGTLVKMLDERHLLLYFANNPINNVLSRQRWDGSFVETSGDYLQVVNANLGGTKANYYVQNSYEYGVSAQTRDGLLRGELRLNYKHTGEDGAWPGGPYTDYIRIYTQNGSKLTGASLITSGTETPQDVFSGVGVYREDGLNVFSYSIKINPGSEASLIFNYDLPESLILTPDNLTYSLYWQKQSGVGSDPVKLNFDKPFGMDIIEKTSGSVYENDSLVYSTDLNKDRYFYIKLK